MMNRFYRLTILVALIFVLSTAKPSVWAGDVIAVCPPAFRDSFENWLSHRRADGLSVTVLDSDRDFESLQQAISRHADERTRYVILVGNAPVIGTVCDPAHQIPIAYFPSDVTSKWGSTPTYASDLPLADFDQDGVPDAVVGRLPVKTSTELQQLTDRIIQYERSADFGDWRGNVQLVGGIGGFGGMIDTAIESVTRTVITGVLPAETNTRVLYASPNHLFYPKQRSFTESVLENYQRGSRFWVYAGHGHVTELDRVPATILGRPVLDRESVAKLQRPASSSPIAILLACYTGAVDAPEDCLAQRMLTTSGGPIAVFAGSRVTMPYGNATAAIGLIDSVYRKKSVRLGDAWLQTQLQMQSEDMAEKSVARSMIDGLATMISPAGSDLAAERREHARLYNLLGDPTLHLHPPQTMSIQVASGFNPGEAITIQTSSPIDGKLTVSIHRPLGTVSEDQTDPNDTCIATMTVPIVAGTLAQNQVRLAADVRGPLTVRSFVAGANGWATAAARTIIRH